MLRGMLRTQSDSFASQKSSTVHVRLCFNIPLLFEGITAITKNSLSKIFMLNLMFCAIWYHLYNLKNVKNTHGGVLLLAKLKAEACFVFLKQHFEICPFALLPTNYNKIRSGKLIRIEYCFVYIMRWKWRLE